LILSTASDWEDVYEWKLDVNLEGGGPISHVR